MGNHFIKNKEEVDAFLHQFLPKMDIWGIIFVDRKKNQEAMRTLGITYTASKEIIKDIHTIDYVETIIDAFLTVTCGSLEKTLMGKNYM